MKNAHAERIKTQIKNLQRYKGAERIIKRYKTLIDRQSDGTRRELAEKKSPRIIEAFEKKINPVIVGKREDNVFDSRVAESTVRALGMFEKILKRYPRKDITGDYVGTVVAMEETTVHSYIKNDEETGTTEMRLQRGSILSVIENSLDIMEKWKLTNEESTMAKLKMLDWSIACTARVVLLLDGNGIPDLDVNGIKRLHPSRNELVMEYLKRGLLPLGENGFEDFRIIRSYYESGMVSESVDSAVRKMIESHKKDMEVTRLVIDMNKRVSEIISKRELIGPKAAREFIVSLVRGINVLLEKEKLERLN